MTGPLTVTVGDAVMIHIRELGTDWRPATVEPSDAVDEVRAGGYRFRQRTRAQIVGDRRTTGSPAILTLPEYLRMRDADAAAEALGHLWVLYDDINIEERLDTIPAADLPEVAALAARLVELLRLPDSRGIR